MRMLGPHGNPRAQNLFEIMKRLEAQEGRDSKFERNMLLEAGQGRYRSTSA